MPADYSAWSRVASCESGGWRVLGYAYPDSLGISRANWLAFGGTPLAPGSVSRAGEVAEIRVADRLAARYHVPIPDRYGCGAW
jgi:Transglycosylase-like domain